MMRQLPLELSHQEAFEDLVINFILDQEEKVRQLEEYICVIGSDFMQLSLEVVGKLREEIRIEQNKTKKIKKITRFPDTKDLEPLYDHKFSEPLTKEVPSHTPKIVSPKSLYVKHVRTIFPSPPLVRESTFGFKSGTKNNRNVKSRHDVANSSLQSTPQVLSSFEEYTLLVTYLEEVEETLGTPIEVEPLDETQLEDLGLNACNHDLPLSPMEVPSFYEPEPQPQSLTNCPSLDISLGKERGPEPPIKPHSVDSFRMKDIGSLGVDFSNMEMIENEWELESKEVSFLGRGLNSPVRPKEVEKKRTWGAVLVLAFNQPIRVRMGGIHHQAIGAFGAKPPPRLSHLHLYNTTTSPLPPPTTSTSIPTTTDPPDPLPHRNQHPRCHHSATVNATLTPPSPPR
ncbi:hypothetical protein Tco_1032728 [Tanacetum coccineum]|uniref:Uncharacterized protein n=1 Tax=Tanacetum coccineum TaxID=301880 RepID=A0ABQ5GCM2_9ASTR